MMEKTFKNNKVKNIFMILSACILTIIPFKNILITGIYKWHITQAEFWQGGLELIGFVILTIMLISIARNKVYSIIILMGGLYLSMNGVIIPFIVVYVYFEALNYIGCVANSVNSKEMSSDIIKNLVAGISLWGCGAVLLSLLKYGGFNELRVLTVVMVLISLIMGSKKNYTLLPTHFKNLIINQKRNKEALILIVLSVFIILALVAKTNIAHDYDSLWYGLRPEHVLIGENSFYDSLGFASFVYYYPKLMELLFIPISNLGDYSFIITGNIFILVFFMIAVYRLCRYLFKESTYVFKNGLILLVITIPAVAGIATTAKPDILGAFLVFCGFGFFVEFLIDKEVSAVCYMLIVLMLATGTKLTYILWGGLLFITIIMMTLWLLYKKQIAIRDCKFNERKSEYFIMLSGVVFTLGIHYRTFRLTGYPIYPTFLNIFNKLGFKAVYPAKDMSINVTELTIGGARTIIERLYAFVFNPNPLSKVIMLWTSSLLVFCIIGAIVYYKKDTIKNNMLGVFFVAVIMIQGCVMLYYLIGIIQPDGNYFIIPMLLMTIILLYFIKLDKQVEKGNWWRISFFLFFVLHVCVMFVSHPSWTYGTKPFSNSIIIDNFETKKTNSIIAKANGYGNIEEYISENFKGKRIVSSYLDYTIIGRIDGAIETIYEIGNPHFSNSLLTSNYEAFEEYITKGNIEGIFLLNEDDSILRNYTNKYIEINGYNARVEDEGGEFFWINRPRTVGTDIKTIGIAEGQIYEDGWMGEFIEVRVNTGNGNLILSGNTIEELLPNVVTVYIDDEKIEEYEIVETNFKATIELKEKNKNRKVKIVCDKTFIPMEVGLNLDRRELGIVINEMRFEEIEHK